MCVRDSVGYVWLHCITWIITARSPGPRLSLNGQSQLKLGYRRPRAEQPGHQESKIKQRLLLPPKNRPPSAAGNQVSAEKRKKKKPSCGFSFSQPPYPPCISSWPPGMWSCHGGRLRRRRWPQTKKGGGLGVTAWPPGGKINGIIMSGNNKVTFIHRPTFERRWKCPDEEQPLFFFFTPSHPRQSSFWSSLVHGAHWTRPYEAWGKVRGGVAIVQSRQVKFLPKMGGWFFWCMQYVYFDFFSSRCGSFTPIFQTDLI